MVLVRGVTSVFSSESVPERRLERAPDGHLFLVGDLAVVVGAGDQHGKVIGGTHGRGVREATARVGGARWVPSPHCDERPEGEAIALVVIHNISLPPGEFGGQWIDDLFLGRLDGEAHPYFREVAGMRVSSHFLIRRDGELIQ